MHNRCRSRSGFAVLELAAWSVVILPVALLGFSYGTFFHNETAMRMVPSAVLRETVGAVSRWSSNGDAGEMVADIGRLRELIQNLTLRAAHESLGRTYALTDTSATACFWVLAIDPLSGRAISEQAQECAQIGTLSLSASMNARVQEARAEKIGVPLGVAGSLETYAHQVVLVGVEVAGLFHGIAEWRKGVAIQYGEVKKLREEVEL